MDQQGCFLTLESFNYNNQEVDMRWIMSAPPISILKAIELPDFDLANFSTRIEHVVRSVPHVLVLVDVYSRSIRQAYGTN